MFSRIVIALLSVASIGLATAASAADRPLEIGYLPILPDAQLFVGLEQGNLQQKGAPAPKLVQFQNGPAMTQALIAGQLDVAYVGIGPALVARAKGADLKVVASNIVEQVNVVALGPLANYFTSGDPATAFARFAKDKGHKPTIASYPQGAVPETVFQYWIRKRLNIDPNQVHLIYQGEAQIEQSLLTGAIDGAVVLEPTASLVLSKLPQAKVVAHGGQLFPHQPGAVLVVRDKLIRDNPQVVQQLVAAQVAATKLLRDDPEKASGYVQKYVSGGRLDRGLLERAIRNSHDQFEADPGTIVSSTKNLQAFQSTLGSLKAGAVDVDRFIDTSFYNKVAK